MIDVNMGYDDSAALGDFFVCIFPVKRRPLSSRGRIILHEAVNELDAC